MMQRPTPIHTDIRINWVVYEFTTRQEAELWVVMTRMYGTEVQTPLSTTDKNTGALRHFVWSRD